MPRRSQPKRSSSTPKQKPRKTRKAAAKASLAEQAKQITPEVETKEKLEQKESDDNLVLTYYGAKIGSPEELLKAANVDTNIWEVDKVVINNWEVSGKRNTGQTYREETGTYTWGPQKLWKTGNRQIKVWLRRKTPDHQAMEALLKRLEGKSPKRPKLKRPALEKCGHERALEISLMDVHYGMMCFTPESDYHQSLESSEQLCSEVVELIIERAKPYGPFHQVLFTMGNDFLHVDNVWHQTTAGTPQPESLPWHYIYERGEELLIAIVERLRRVAPVHVIEVPGNHDRQSAFTMGRMLNAWYRNDEDVTVDVSASPYKFWRWGKNLIGFEHGHSVKGVRLAGLMANCCPKDWYETDGGYREFHLGDQHRKGSSVPAYFEEQGVSVEYICGLTTPNGWHRLKSFNHQKTGGVGFVWDKATGPLARLPIHVNPRTGKPLGT